VNVIKLCALKGEVLSKLPLSEGMGSEKLTEACGGQVRKTTAAIENLTCSDSTELMEEMDFMLSSDDSESSDELDELLD